MNRGIIFRAWNKKEGRFLTDEEVNEFNLFYFFDWDNLVTQQFFGLLDKNGKEIFEGDIVKTSKYKGEVCFNLDTGCVEIITGETTSKLLWGTRFENEVIGNIFQNPDLLK